MASLRDAEMAVESLPDHEYSLFRQWFIERDWDKWDRQIEADSASGKLDFLIREARIAKDAGTLREL